MSGVHCRAQVGDGQTVRLSLLSFGGRQSSGADDVVLESPAKTCYEVGAVQVSDAPYTRHGFRLLGHVCSRNRQYMCRTFNHTICVKVTYETRETHFITAQRECCWILCNY